MAISFHCPVCGQMMEQKKLPKGFYYRCANCQGRAIPIMFLRRLLDRDLVTELAEKAARWRGPERKDCPHCHTMMPELPVLTDQGEVKVDVCARCQLMWFDTTDYERLGGRSLRRLDTESDIPDPKAQDQKLAMILVLGLLGIPVKHDTPKMRRFPIATWVLGFVLLITGGSALIDLEKSAFNFGFVPAEAFRYAGLTAFTYFFIHGGVLHLLSNLYFLMVFGDNVEDRLGHWRMLLLVFGGSLAGAILHAAFDPRSEIPLVGASGGISSIIAFYGLRFPWVRLLIFFIPIWAWLALLLWIALQLLTVALQVQGGSDVSALAHFGGVAVGVWFWVWDKLRVRR